MSSSRVDRTRYVPSHKGDTVLPNAIFFNRLLRFAHHRPPNLAIRDVVLGVEKTYLDLLTDVLAVRNHLRSILPQNVIQDVENGKETFIGILISGGYEYSVSVLAILALGAAIVPMSTALPVEEAAYFVEKSRQVAILCSQKSEKLTQSLATYVSTKRNSSLPCVTVNSLFQSVPLDPFDIFISSNRALDDNSAGVVIFTSGTTGPPKGSMHRRSWTCDTALAMIDHYGITSQDVLQHILPVHHATGLGVMFFPWLFAGALIEFRSGGFSAEYMWERWKQGGLTFFSGVPTIFMRMKRYFEQNLAQRSDVDQYIRGARQFKVILCGTSALPSPIQEFWTNIREGKRIYTRYGATEFGAVFKVRMDSDDAPEASVGEITPGVSIKLSDGDEGEVLTKSSGVFLGYLDDPQATAAAHDDQGFFKTGDIARREGKYYFILGRASQDIIKSGGYKISALDIEREVLALPYIEEVMVVGVEDEEFGQRVAALVSLRKDQDVQELSINRLRTDLRDKLAGYKMPTLLRVVEDELPKTATGKVLKRVLGPKFFPSNWSSIAPPPGNEKSKWIQAWSRETSKL